MNLRKHLNLTSKKHHLALAILQKHLGFGLNFVWPGRPECSLEDFLRELVPQMIYLEIHRSRHDCHDLSNATTWKTQTFSNRRAQPSEICTWHPEWWDQNVTC